MFFAQATLLRSLGILLKEEEWCLEYCDCH